MRYLLLLGSLAFALPLAFAAEQPNIVFFGLGKGPLSFACSESEHGKKL
jgi:hypothetical protein